MSIKSRLIVFIATLAIIIVSAVIGNILESNGTLGRMTPNAVAGVKAFYFGLFCILVFSMIPLALSYFINMQINIGNGDRFLIQWIQDHRKGVVCGYWLFCIIGLCIAVPAAIKGGFFR